MNVKKIITAVAVTGVLVVGGVFVANQSSVKITGETDFVGLDDTNPALDCYYGYNSVTLLSGGADSAYTCRLGVCGGGSAYFSVPQGVFSDCSQSYTTPEQLTECKIDACADGTPQSSAFTESQQAQIEKHVENQQQRYLRQTQR